MNRRGEAAVIGTVLLIVAVMVAGSIVAYYTIQQAKSIDSSCLEALNSIQFVDVGFTCRMPEAEGGPLTSFSVKIADDSLEGFQLGIQRGGDAETYEIRTGAFVEDLCVLESTFGAALTIPSAGNTITYVTRGDIQRVFVSPILKGGKGCYAEVRRDAVIDNECINPEVESRLEACNVAPSSVCGNGVREGSEQCDDSNLNDGDGCSSSCQIEAPRVCTLSNLHWESTSQREGSLANVMADVADCDGSTVSVRIYENDASGADIPANVQPADVTLGAGTTTLTRSWVAEWLSDAPSETNPPEYYFVLAVQGGASYTSSQVSPNELLVNACGDSIVNAGEQCDGSAVGVTCTTLPDGEYTGGTVSCYPRGNPSQCTFDVRACLGTFVCGNGLIEGAEQCDDDNANSNDGCSSSCQIEGGWLCSGQPSVCTQCGNGVLNSGEQCDGGIPSGVSCSTYGGVGGSLSCTSSCQIDTSGCSMCGDGLVGVGESCDPPGSMCNDETPTGPPGGGITSVGDGICSADCRVCEPAAPSPFLNGGSWSPTSAAEGDAVSLLVSGIAVANLPYEIEVWEDDGIVGDDLITSSPLTGSFNSAGDPLNVGYTAPWQCDGEVFGFCLAGDPEYYFVVRLSGVAGSDLQSSGMLSVSERSPTCGNGLVQEGEQCDPPEAICSAEYGESCNYCSGACMQVAIQGPFCGDGMRTDPEVCDGSLLSGQTCTSQGFAGGALGCSSDCLTFDTSACTMQVCGNNVRELPEQCDGSDLQSQTCSSLGFTSGTLSCGGSCTFDTSACTTSGGGPIGGGPIGGGDA